MFAARGFDATTVRDIASAAGVSDGALYAHFAGKRELYEAIFETRGPAVVEEAIARCARSADDDPAAFVERLVAELMRAWNHQDARRFMSVFTREMASRREGGLALLDGIATAQTTLALIFQTYRRNGSIRSATDDRDLAWELIAPLIHLRFLFLQSHSPPSDRARAQTYARSHARFFLEAIVAKKPEIT